MDKVEKHIMSIVSLCWGFRPQLWQS